MEFWFGAFVLVELDCVESRLPVGTRVKEL